MDDIVAVVHGSTVLVQAFIKVASENELNVMQYTHFVTSADATAQLPSGCRYHQINSPTPDGSDWRCKERRVSKTEKRTAEVIEQAVTGEELDSDKEPEAKETQHI